MTNLRVKLIVFSLVFGIGEIYSQKSKVISPNNYYDFSLNVKNDSVEWEIIEKNIDLGFGDFCANENVVVVIQGCEGCDTTSILGFDINTGKQLWEKRPDWVVQKTFVVDENTLFYLGKFGLTALNMYSGETIWTFNWNRSIYESNTPVIYKNGIYITDSTSILVIDINTGKLINRTAFKDSFPRGFSLKDHSLFGLSGDVSKKKWNVESNSIFCLNLKTNKLLWTYKNDRDTFDRSESILTKDYFILASNNNRKILVFSTQDFKLLYEIEKPLGIFDFVVENNNLYILHMIVNGKSQGLTSFDMKNGTEIIIWYHDVWDAKYNSIGYSNFSVFENCILLSGNYDTMVIDKQLGDVLHKYPSSTCGPDNPIIEKGYMIIPDCNKITKISW